MPSMRARWSKRSSLPRLFCLLLLPALVRLVKARPEASWVVSPTRPVRFLGNVKVTATNDATGVEPRYDQQ